MAIRSFSTEHTRDTAAPRTYWQHGAVAISKSAQLIWLGLAGVVHGFLPEIKGLQFYTSTGILRAAHYLMMCGRHDREIERIFGPNFMETVRLERPRKTAVDIMYRDTYRHRKAAQTAARSRRDSTPRADLATNTRT
jgi:hypothetical protein